MSVDAPAKISRARKIPRWAVAAITAAVCIAVFAGYQMAGTMWLTDPAGNRACNGLADAIDPESGKVQGTMENSFAIATHARDSKSPAIRATVRQFPELSDLGFPVLADLEALHAACAGAGVDLPPYQD